MNNDHKFSMVVLDVSSQEPMLNTFISKEPRWMEIFRNRELRELNLTKYIDILISVEFGVDVNKYSSKRYWMWLDNEFSNSFIDLIKFNLLVDKMRSGDDSVRKKVLFLCKGFITRFREFLENDS